MPATDYLIMNAAKYPAAGMYAFLTIGFILPSKIL